MKIFGGIAALAFSLSASAYTSCLPEYVHDLYYPLSLGFFDPQSPAYPEPVRKATESVVEIYVPDEAFQGVAYRPEILAMLNEGGNSFVGYGRGTAFALERGDYLITAHHVVKPYAEMRLNSQNRVRQQIPVVIRIGETYQRLNATLDPQRTRQVVQRQRQRGWDRLADYTLLKFDRELVAPLKAGDSLALKYKDPVFILGFPGKTTSRHLYERPDSDGLRMRISSGVRVDPYKALMSAGVYERDLCADVPNIERWKDQYIFTSADATPGNSGGPMLNERGEVIGILTGAPVDPQAIAAGGAAVSEFLSLR